MMQLDRAHFDGMTGGDADLQQEILNLFRAQVGAWTQLLTPETDWRHAAHTMKGSARGIGLWPLAQACEAAESADADSVENALAELRRQLGEALATLDVVTQAAAAP